MREMLKMIQEHSLMLFDESMKLIILVNVVITLKLQFFHLSSYLNYNATPYPMPVPLNYS